MCPRAAVACEIGFEFPRTEEHRVIAFATNTEELLVLPSPRPHLCRACHEQTNSLACVNVLRSGSETDVKPDELTAAQARIITAALDLFSRHGVGGTSLQMIADEIGVTKAAVYHQYPAKDEIVLAAAKAELARLEAVISVAEAERSARRRRDALVAGIVDLAIARRGTVGTIMSDPVIVGFFGEHDEFRDVMHRLRGLLIGDDRDPQASIRVAMLVAAISGAVTNPVVAGFDDDVLRAELLRLARRFLGLPS